MSSEANKKDPLHGVTLKIMLERLQEYYGWDGLSAHIDIDDG